MQQTRGTSINPTAVRSLFVLEPIAEMMWPGGFEANTAQVQIRLPGASDWTFTACGSSSIDVLRQVGRHEVDMAVMNPTSILTMAYRGKGGFPEPMDLRVVSTIPSLDWLGVAVAERTGLGSLAEVKERRYPLKLSLYQRPGESQDYFTGALLDAYGFSLADLVSWGGSISRDPGLWVHGDRYEKVRRGEIDAIIDEGLNSFIPELGAIEMRLLPIEEPFAERLESVGLHLSVIHRAQFPNLPADIPALDFSGWPVYTHSAVPDELIYAFCRGLEARFATVPYGWGGWSENGGDMPLDEMCRDTPAAPLKIPLHPGAERYWKDSGHLG